MFGCTENIEAVIGSLQEMSAAVDNKDADAVPAAVGRAAGSAPETDIGKPVR